MPTRTLHSAAHLDHHSSMHTNEMSISIITICQWCESASNRTQHCCKTSKKSCGVVYTLFNFHLLNDTYQRVRLILGTKFGKSHHKMFRFWFRRSICYFTNDTLPPPPRQKVRVVLYYCDNSDLIRRRPRDLKPYYPPIHTHRSISSQKDQLLHNIFNNCT